MTERAELQQDVMRELLGYSENLIPAMQLLITELRTGDAPDTSQFLNEVIQGVNWEIEVYNQCADAINERSSYIDKKAMVTAVGNLGHALGHGSTEMVADCLEEDFLPFLNKLALACELAIGASDGGSGYGEAE